MAANIHRHAPSRLPSEFLSADSMNDTTVRVPGYAKEGHASGTSDDDLDVIEMTPRNGEDRTRPADGWFAYSQFSFAESPAMARSGSTPHGGQDAAFPAGSPQSPKTPSRRDPSRPPQVSSGDNGHDSGILQSFVSGLTKALAGDSEDDTLTPTPSQRSIAKRPSERLSPHSEVSSASPGSDCSSPFKRVDSKFRGLLPEELRMGEDDSMREKTLFSGADDPQAQAFSEFLEDDGAVARLPVLCMSDYWRGREPSDLWAYPHNALKRELFDMYEIFGVIRLRYLSLTWADLYDLRAWWRLFNVFWRQYVTLENKFLNPLVRRVLKANQDGTPAAARRTMGPLNEIREWLAVKFEEVNGYFEEFERLPTGSALSLLSQATDALGFRMLEYFNKQEATLPPVLKHHYAEATGLGVELQFLDVIRESGFVEECLVHYLRWMPSGKGRNRWMASRLRWGERSSMRRMYRSYARTRGDIVDGFRRKLNE